MAQLFSMFGSRHVSMILLGYRSQRMLHLMNPLSAIASILRVVGIEIPIVQILQEETDAIKTANERVEHIVLESRATKQAWLFCRRLCYRITVLLLMIVSSIMKGASKSLISSGGVILSSGISLCWWPRQETASFPALSSFSARLRRSTRTQRDWKRVMSNSRLNCPTSSI